MEPNNFEKATDLKAAIEGGIEGKALTSQDVQAIALLQCLLQLAGIHDALIRLVRIILKMDGVKDAS